MNLFSIRRDSTERINSLPLPLPMYKMRENEISSYFMFYSLNWRKSMYASRSPFVKRRLHTLFISVSTVKLIPLTLWLDPIFLFIFLWVLYWRAPFLFTENKVQHMFQPWRTFVKIRDICRLVKKTTIRYFLLLIKFRIILLLTSSMLRAHEINNQSDLEPDLRRDHF